MARKGEVGRSSNPVPTKRKVGGLQPSKIPKPYIGKELKALSKLGEGEN